MSIVRHEPGPILSLAVENGNTVYLAGIVPKILKNDIKGQTAEVLAEIDRPVPMTFSSVSRRLLPGASGISRVALSGAFTKPGSPPRGDASKWPSLPPLANTTKGDSSTKRRQRLSRRPSCFLRERSLAGG